MQLFYFPHITEGLIQLPEEEARHAIRVLRKQVGDRLDAVDGRGGWYQGIITDLDKRNCWVNFQRLQQEDQRADYRIIMAVSPTKSNERFEWFLEKATEIGVDEIIPIACTRTERPRIRHDRYEKVLIAAMKQSLQAWLPRLHPLTKLVDLLKEEYPTTQKYIGWCDDAVNDPLSTNYPAGENVIILIGPEGDFTEEEVAKARKLAYQPITLGPNRLRTETAAVVATSTIALCNQMNTKIDQES